MARIRKQQRQQRTIPDDDERAFIGAAIAYAVGWRLIWHSKLPAGIGQPGWELVNPERANTGVYIVKDNDAGITNDIAAYGFGIKGGSIPDFSQDIWLIYEYLLTDDVPYVIDGTGEKPQVTIGDLTVTADSYLIYDQAAAIAKAWLQHRMG